MIPATAAAIPGLPLPAVDSCRPPARQRKLFSSARPHPKGPSLIVSPAHQDQAEAARLLGNFHACGLAQDRRPGLPMLTF